MNVIELLKNDHRKALGMIEQLERADDRMSERSRMKLFSELKCALDIHTKVEERIFYPALEDHASARVLVDESFKEHRRLSRILERMNVPIESRSSNSWKDRLDELKQNVELHVDKEEHELFPKAEKLLGEDRLEDMFFEAERMKSGQSEADSLIFPADRFGVAD